LVGQHFVVSTAEPEPEPEPEPFILFLFTKLFICKQNNYIILYLYLTKIIF
jgi:hypothetical protein